LKTIINLINEISETIVNTLANNSNLDDNFSNILDITIYFNEEVFKKKEGINQTIEKYLVKVNVSK